MFVNSCEHIRDVLFQYFAESRMVDFDVRLQRAKGDVTVSDPTLEQEPDIPGVVGPCSPYAICRERRDTFPHVYESTGYATHRRLAGTIAMRLRGRRTRLNIMIVVGRGDTPTTTCGSIPRALQDVNASAPSTNPATHLSHCVDEN